MSTVPDTRHMLGWLAAAAAIAFAVPAVFSMGLRWERSLFLIPYVGIVGMFLVLYFSYHPLSIRQWLGYWPYALIGTAVASFLLLGNIAGQPSSAVPVGWQLVLALGWVGLAYGAVDGLLLNVFPVLAIQEASLFESCPTMQSPLLLGLLALAASLAMTVIYHLGYTEFQGAAIVSAMIGNAIITLTYLLTGSPLAAVATHVIMHMAAE
ncbi:MAG: hypothetical protein WAN86_25740 [Hyphomicrobiaceae bacterium]